MAKKKTKAAGKTLVLLHDGACWSGGIARSDGTWERQREEASPADGLPESLLQWGLQGGALHLRVAIASELFDFAGDADEDWTLLAPAELYERLREELAELAGLESDELVPAVACAHHLKLGFDEARLIGAALSLSLVQEFHQQCEHHGLIFDGIASLQALLLVAHALERQSPNEGLLFLGPKESLVAAIAARDHFVSVRALPGVGSDCGALNELSGRLERRLKPFGGRPLRVVVSDAGCASAEAWLRERLPDALRVEGFSHLESSLMQALAGASHYMLAGPVALAGLPPTVRDSKFTGGLICGASILLTLFTLGALWGAKAWQRHALQTLTAQIATLEQAQKSAKSDYEGVQSQLKQIKQLYGSLNSAPPKVNRSFTDILLALSKTLPEYSRITSVVQEARCTRIAGSTLWPQEVSGFSVALQEALQPQHLRVIPLTMTPAEGSSDTLFEMEVR